jgi:hypothetical protein
MVIQTCFGTYINLANAWWFEPSAEKEEIQELGGFDADTIVLLVG